MCRDIQFGIYDPPAQTFVNESGAKLGDISQWEEVISFGKENLKEGCKGIYKEVSRSHAMQAKDAGAVISSAFTVWKEKDGKKKGRFVVNFSRQWTHWTKGYVRMKGLVEFAMYVELGDHLVPIDVEKGHWHMRLHTSMRGWFILR